MSIDLILSLILPTVEISGDLFLYIVSQFLTGPAVEFSVSGPQFPFSLSQSSLPVFLRILLWFCHKRS